jgi:hypothetical protein
MLHEKLHAQLSRELLDASVCGMENFMGLLDWMDLNGDGEIDSAEWMLGEELMCSSREEHEALFGDDGDFDEEFEDEDDFDF